MGDRLDNIYDYEETCRIAQHLWRDKTKENIKQKEAIIYDLSEKLNLLEEDFTYNLRLLKIRENENYRCHNENLELTKLIKVKTEEIESLKLRLHSTEQALQNLNLQYQKDKRALQKLIVSLNNTQNDLNVCQKRTEAQQVLLSEREQHLKKLTENLNELTDTNKKLVLENSTLRKQIKNYESEKVTIGNDLYTKEQKLNDLRKENKFLIAENKRIQNEKIELIKQLEIVKKSSETNNAKFSAYNNLEEINKNLIQQLNLLQQSTQEVTNQNKTLEENYKKLQNVACALLKDRNEIMKIFKILKDRNIGVNNSEYKKVLHQNDIMKEVIKKLAYERNQNAISNRKIKQLEERVSLLKSYLNRNGSSHIPDTYCDPRLA